MTVVQSSNLPAGKAGFKVQSLIGFTLVELLVTIGIFSTLIGISTISLLNAARKSSLSGTAQVLVADIKAVQMRAMVGDDDGSGNAADYGVHFETSSYTQFRGATFSQTDPNNFKVDLPDNTQFVPVSSDIVFAKGSGEITSSATVTIKDINDGNQMSVTINKYGVVTGVN